MITIPVSEATRQECADVYAVLTKPRRRVCWVNVYLWDDGSQIVGPSAVSRDLADWYAETAAECGYPCRRIARLRVTEKEAA